MVGTHFIVLLWMSIRSFYSVALIAMTIIIRHYSCIFKSQTFLFLTQIEWNSKYIKNVQMFPVKIRDQSIIICLAA